MKQFHDHYTIIHDYFMKLIIYVDNHLCLLATICNCFMVIDNYWSLFYDDWFLLMIIEFIDDYWWLLMIIDC